MVIGTIEKDGVETINEEPKEIMLLGFEKDPPLSIKKIQTQDPLEEIDIGDGSKKRPTYISSKIEPEFKIKQKCGRTEATNSTRQETCKTDSKKDLRFYVEASLGFEKDPPLSIKKIQAQDPLEEIDIGDGSKKRPTYISSKIEPELRFS
ncbi:hypothetical protein MTR_2g043080 [Medicago truncatula]|uniref:Uncharacterized protein n=1 Tax=Medicago truncatula TaxID=3880 RepID=A0A072V6A0_MEDTR|nr:hypothetical protein MTR_2g043080 [Medicago truncatula]